MQINKGIGICNELMTTAKSIKTGADWKSSYESAIKYLTATTRLINERMMAVRVGADSEAFNNQTAMIKRDMKQLDNTYKTLQQSMEYLRNTKTITNREYHDFTQLLASFNHSFQDAKSKLNLPNTLLAGEGYVYHVLLFHSYVYIFPLEHRLLDTQIHFTTKTKKHHYSRMMKC